MKDLIGKNFGRYKILEPLGEGGMAAVYQGYDERLRRTVAIKIIKVPSVGENRFLTRFEREAEALAQLSHPNIVDVYDYGDENGLPYLVMEYLSGGTFKQYLGKPVPLQDAAKAVLPIAKALAYAHSQGILHRDVKPSNILIREDGEPVLTDFGIAARVESQHTLTGTGLGIGTPEYMSPEQGLGKKLDGRTDMYSLGVILYELVTGKKPFEGATPAEIAIKQNTQTAMRPSQILPDLDDLTDRVILKALERDPDHRYADMAAFIEVLESLVQGQPEEKFFNIQLQAVAGKFVAEDQQTIDSLSAEFNEAHSGKRGAKRNSVLGLVAGGIIFVGLIAFGFRQFGAVAKPIPTVTETALATVTPEALNTPTPLPSPTVTATFTPTVEPTPEVITIENVDRLVLIKTLEVEQDAFISSVAFSPSSTYLAAGDDSGIVTIFDLASGEIIKSLEGHSDTVSGVSFSPDESFIATGSYDGTVRLWLTENGRQIGEFHGHSGRVLDVKFSPDGSVVASSGMEGTIRLWDIGSGKNIKTFLDTTFGWGMIPNIDFSPKGDKLVSPRIEVWNIASGSLELRIKPWNTSSASFVDYSPYGTYIAGLSNYGYYENQRFTIQVWQAENGQEVFKIVDSGLVYIQRMCFTADEKALIVAGPSERTQIDNRTYYSECKTLFFDSQSGELVKTLPSCIGDYMSSDGTLLAQNGMKSIAVYAVR